MAKSPNQQGQAPVENADFVTKGYADANYSSTTDADAIHDNVAGEINAITTKATPVAADVAVIEDSEDSFNKKKITLTDLLGGGSSGPVAAAQGDYLRGSIATDQLNIGDGDAVLYDNVDVSRGSGISLNTGNGQITLEPNRTYLLRAQVYIDYTGAAYREFGWYDVTANAEVPATRISHRTTTASAHEGSQSVSMCVVSPTVQTVYEFRSLASPVTTNTVGTDLIALYSNNNFEVVEIGAVQADVVGGLEFMDIIEVGADTQTVTFGASGEGRLQRALDGDVDEAYFIEFWLPTATGVVEHSLRPNGVATNQLAASGFMGETTGDGEHTTMVFAANSPGRVTAGTIEFQAKTGKGRGYQSHTFETNQTASSWRYDFAGLWTDTTTNITSLDMHCNTAGGIKAGARFVLWRRTRNNMRSDVAAVYERMAMETVDPAALVTTERTVGHSVYGGSIVGVSARVENAVTAGSITVNVKANGVTKLTAVLDTTNPTSRVVREAIGIAKFAADENISVEFVPSSYDNAGSVASAVTVQVHMVNSGLVTQNDRVVAKTVLSANATTLLVQGLNGDVDGVYEVEGDLLLTTAAVAVDMEPNGNGTESDLFSAHRLNNAIPTRTNAGWRIFSQGAAVSTYHQVQFRMKIMAARTKNGVSRFRSYECRGGETYEFDATNHALPFDSIGVIENTTNNLTSLEFVSTVASGILAGSEIIVRRIKA